MFPPEIEDGNIEYKRHLCSNELKSYDDSYNIRFQQLVTQLKYRLSEGNGLAIYYLGVEDDGTIYKLSTDKKTKSVAVLKKMALHLEAKLVNVSINKDYIRVVIKDKVSSNFLPEKRVLLLGDTEAGKTTFLSYLIKNKIDTESCKARLFILNHKHELETGKTSSFNYQYLNFNKSKYVFVDTPGDDILFTKNIKTRNKIILSFKFDLIIFFNKDEIWDKRQLYIYYANFLKIPYCDINLFSKKSKINLVNPIAQTDMMKIIESEIETKTPSRLSNKISLTNFHLLQAYPHIDMGWIISGFLSTGKLCVDQELFWYDYDKVSVQINSIYVNNNPVNEVEGPITVTVTLKKISKITNKPRFGFLSNINYTEIKSVKILWIYFNDPKILNESDITVYVKNQTILLKKGKYRTYYLVYPKYTYNITNKIFIYEKDNSYAFGKIVGQIFDKY
jgi:GTPase